MGERFRRIVTPEVRAVLSNPKVQTVLALIAIVLAQQTLRGTHPAGGTPKEPVPLSQSNETRESTAATLSDAKEFMGEALNWLAGTSNPKLIEAERKIPELDWKFQWELSDPSSLPPRPFRTTLWTPSKESWQMVVIINPEHFWSTPPQALAMHLSATFRHWQLLNQLHEQAQKEGVPFKNLVFQYDNNRFIGTEAQAWKETTEMIENDPNLSESEALQSDPFITKLRSGNYWDKEEFEKVAR